MLKLLATGILAAITCTLMACSGAQGPTESDPNGSTAAANTSASETRYYYTCNGGDTRPCSDAEFLEIINSASYNPQTHGFTNKYHQACTTAQCGDATSTPICPQEY